MLPTSMAVSVIGDARASAMAIPVVLVEDDDDLRAAITFSLDVEGMAVVAFKTAESLLHARPPQCACFVIDYWLPGINGLALLSRLRLLGVRAPALLVTSNPSAFLRARADAAGARIIEKPLTGDAVAVAVRGLTEF
jgi:FixJ family two-component response regulator